MAKQRVKASKKVRPQSTKNKSEQLSELRDWIDEQMNMEDFKSQESPKPSAKKKNTTDMSTLSKTQNVQELPGNHLLPIQDQKMLGVRENRYGLQGDNGYNDIVKAQRLRDGIIDKSIGSPENILDFTQKPESPGKSEESLDVMPVKDVPRKIVNQPVDEPEIPEQVAGMMNVKHEAKRQLTEQEQKELSAVSTIQKWARGWRDRRRARKVRNRMQREIDASHASFVNTFKAHEKFNMAKFISKKQEIRAKIATENVDDDSISE